ncbi:calcium homeostasis modulator protein-like [Stegostoma tigrinum]|uniref:calcium homeostasis modulator protein-like n=1 Tax=Stegostoma tigrinum TaxID=3053191 RepID=UPI00286FFF51|nr:calcium homeostasis modulator protein-like [Stegostoma tigrinum]XP_048376265.2 calcium homeostasis modulator protein-like [Stegostoma tigrinum]
MDWHKAVTAKINNLSLESLSVITQVSGNTAMSLLLFGIETLMEKEIKCPCEQHLNLYYILVTFVVPVIVLLILGFMLQYNLMKRYCKHKKLCCSTFLLVFQASTPAVVWIVLLFLDGDYYSCSKLIGKNETQCGSKCNEEPRATGHYHHCITSQLIGGVVLVSFLMVLFIIHCLRCKYNDHDMEYKVEFEHMCETEKGNLVREKLKDEALKHAQKQCGKTLFGLFPSKASSRSAAQTCSIQEASPLDESETNF